jgi:heme-degrading monooxygenase HmoA
MFMRLVHAKSKPDSIAIIQQVYAEKIIPRLQKMPGCLFSCLIQSDTHPDEGISLTLWDSQAHAEAYEQSGRFQELLGEVKPYLCDSAEWKVQLSKDLQVEYQPVTEEPVLKGYASLGQSDTKILTKRELSLMYLRLFSLKIKEGMMEEFSKIYQEEILPALRGVKGCRFAFMTENIQEKTEALSLTIWDTKQDAINYERSELFTELNDKVKHTFAELFQWKMELEEEAGKKVMTSEDPHSKHYTIVTGKSFDT